MPIYSWKGFDAKTGNDKKGKIEADSEKGARQRLKQRDKIIVAEMKLQSPTAQKKGGGVSLQLFQPKVSVSDLAIMCRQFATLQSAHIPLDESLKALVSQVENTVLKNTLSAVKDSVSEGKSLADSSAAFPGVFSPLYVNMVRAGESSGTLGTVLERLADFLEYQVRIRGQIVSAVTYPAIMILASAGIVSYLFISVVPKLSKVFDNLKVKLPIYTELLIEISGLMQQYWYLGLLLFFMASLGFRSWINTNNGRRTWDQWTLVLPLFGPILMRINVSRFTNTLSTLLNSGVPIIQALDITKNVVTNTVIADILEMAKIEVQEGKSLAACIDRSGKFPGLVTHMIATGERTGQLEEMLEHLSTAYTSEVERKITTMISLIEPIMMVVMFAIVGVVVAAMLVPMMGIMGQMR